MQPLSGNQRPDLLTSLMNMSLVLRLPHEMHPAISSAYVPRLPSFLQLLQNHHVLLTFDKVRNPLPLPRETTSERPKVLRTPQFFTLFDFETCFAPQRRALFRHLNFQKRSEHEVLCAFWLRNVLRATTACNFSSLIWPDGSAPAALASLLFDPPEPQIIGKTQCFATFLPFRAPGSSLFSLFLFLIFFLLLFSSLLFSDSSHLCSSSVHIVESLTSKLPSPTYYILHTTYSILHTIYYLLLTTHYSLLTTYYLLLTTNYQLPTTNYLLLTTNNKQQTTTNNNDDDYDYDYDYYDYYGHHHHHHQHHHHQCVNQCNYVSDYVRPCVTSRY